MKMMKFQTDIPESIYRCFLPFLYMARKFSAIGVKQRAVAESLERNSLREWLGDRREPFIAAFKWALAHPDKDYRVFFVHDEYRERFTNEDCLKLFSLVLRSLEHLDDEGPDIVEQPPADYTPEEWAHLERLNH